MNLRRRVAIAFASVLLACGTADVPAATITAWNFENLAIATYNNPAPSTGTGTASAIGMTNSYNGTTSVNTDDVLQGTNSDTGANGVADTSQIWRVRGQSPGNGWSSQAPSGVKDVGGDRAHRSIRSKLVGLPGFAAAQNTFTSAT